MGGAGVGKGREAGWAGSTRLQCGAWPQELTTYIPAERKAVRDTKQRETFACSPTPQPLPGCPSPEYLHHSLPVGQPCALLLDSTSPPGERDLAPGPHLLSPSPWQVSSHLPGAQGQTESREGEDGGSLASGFILPVANLLLTSDMR